MRTLHRIADRLIARLAPKAKAEAACIYLYTFCSYQPDGSAYCCRHYDNCPSSCYWA